MPTPPLIADQFDSVSSRDHIACFPRKQSEGVAVLSAYLRAGLSRGETVVLAASSKTCDTVCAEMRSSGTDVGAAVARGILLLLRDSIGGRMTQDAFFDSLRGAARRAHADRRVGVRFALDFGHLAPDLLPDGVARDQEAMDRLIEDTGATVLSMYDQGRMTAPVLLEALRVHPQIFVDGRLCENFYFIPASPDGTTQLTPAELLGQRLGHLSSQTLRVEKIRRQTVRLTRFRDTLFSILSSASPDDILSGIAEGVVALGYRMCWIGMARPDGSVRASSIAGAEEGYLRSIDVRWDDTVRGRGPVGICIRTGRASTIGDTARAPSFAPWRETAAARGYASVAAVPLSEAGRVVGAIAVYAGETDAFGPEELEELSLFALQASLVLERALQHRRLAHSRAMETVGAVAGSVAREFGSLLGTVLTRGLRLQNGLPADGPLRSDVEALCKAADTAAELSRKLLVSSLGGENSFRPVVPRDVASSLVPHLARIFRPEIDVKAELSDTPTILGDPDALSQVLLNLCLNARDAMQDGGTITVRTGAVRLSAEAADRLHLPESGLYATMEVSDTGAGMSEEVARRAFEPLFSTHREDGREGLGLSMAYGVARRHGGGIRADSVPGSGTTVTMHLPAAAASSALPVTDPYPRGDATILVVDDEPAIRTIADSFLTSLGYRVVTAEDGEEAVARFFSMKEAIDLVLLDLVMPRKDGPETFRELRRAAPDLRIMLMTGFSLDGVVEDIMRDGAVGLLRKPFGLSELARALKTALGTGS